MHKYLTILTLVLGAGTAQADDFQSELQNYFDRQITDWSTSQIIVDAINAQNAETATYDQAKIDEMDQLWRGFAGMADAEIITNVTQTPAATFLRDRIAISNGVITEAFIMDARGLNVAAASPTSDYWQGDEAKFTQTYPLGAGAVHFGEVEIDDSTQAVQAQISTAITDPATGQTNGALTVGVSLTDLQSASN